MHCMQSMFKIYNLSFTSSILKKIYVTLGYVYFGVWSIDGSRKPEPSSSSFRFSKTEASVYCKHWRRRGLAFSTVVVHTAMAMGREFV